MSFIQSILDNWMINLNSISIPLFCVVMCTNIDTIVQGTISHPAIIPAKVLDKKTERCTASEYSHTAVCTMVPCKVSRHSQAFSIK